MKKRISLVIGFLVLCTILGACSGIENESSESSAIESSGIEAEVVIPPETSSTEIVSVPENIPSSPEESSSSSSEDTSHSENMLPAISTDDTAFNEKFAQNTLDLAYEEEMMSALSANEWVDICSNYSQLWKNEADNAYKELLAVVPDDRYTTLREEQEQWATDVEGQIQDIRSSAQTEGGSLVMFNASSEIMLLYRTRAAELDQELFDYNPDFSFNFAANG